jgi:hypothetical protein
MKCLLLSRLLPEDNLDWAMRRLAELSIAVRRSFISNGCPIWKPEYGLGQAVGDHLYTMYSSLKIRKEARKRAAKREVVKSAAVMVEKKQRKLQSLFLYLFYCDDRNIRLGFVAEKKRSVGVTQKVCIMYVAFFG